MSETNECDDCAAEAAAADDLYGHYVCRVGGRGDFDTPTYCTHR